MDNQPVASLPPLEPKQEAFVREYLIDLNATQAAIRAGYSINSAKEIGCENLTKPNIREEIERQRAIRAERLEIKGDDILRALLIVAFADPADYIHYDEEDKQRVRLLRDIQPQARRAIKELEESNGKVKIKLDCRLKAIELIGKYLGLFEREIDPNSAAGSLAALIEQLNPKS